MARQTESAAGGVATSLPHQLAPRDPPHLAEVTIPGPPACTGDCGGDGSIAVDEILMMVDIALDSANVTTCDVGDANSDGVVTIDEILAAVNNALNGCG